MSDQGIAWDMEMVKVPSLRCLLVQDKAILGGLNKTP